LTTEAWTYEGTFPGPSLVLHSERRAVVTHRNELVRADSAFYSADVVNACRSLAPASRCG
jgi:hypothetical protein